MTSKIIVNTIEADTGISSVTFASNINLQNDSSVLVSSSGVTLGTGSTIAAPSANEITLSTNSAERFRLTSDGKIGIGTDNPDQTLELFKASGTNLVKVTSQANSTIGLEIEKTGSTTQSWRIADGQTVNGALEFYDVTNTATRMIIRDGKVGIGDASPTKPLTVGTTTPVILLDDQSSRTLEIRGPSTTHNATVLTTSTHDLLLGTNNAERFRITSDGKVAIGFNAPAVAGLSIANSSTSLGFEFDTASGFAGGPTIRGYHRPSTTYKSLGITGADIKFGINDVEKLRLTSTGRMGLGTNDPAALLEVRDSENTTKGAAQIRISKGVGNGAAPTSISRADSYLHIGGSEYHTSFGKYNIAFGYTNDEVGSGIPAYIGFVETSLSGYTMGDLVFGTRETYGATDNPTERMRIDKDGHVRFGSSGTGYDSAWSHSNYGNTEVAIDGGGGYGALHFRGDGAGSVNTRFSMGVGDEIFYMCYDDVNARHNIQVNSSGHVTKPAQPAFCVYRSQSGWSLSAGDTFVFNAAEFNVGSHYNTSNGRFTAPVTGTYVFHFYSIYTGNASNDYIQMYKNGARLNVGDVHFTNSVGSAWDAVHYSRVIQLDVNDYVYMRTGSGHTFHGNNWGGWSGYMLG